MGDDTQCIIALRLNKKRLNRYHLHIHDDGENHGFTLGFCVYEF